MSSKFLPVVSKETFDEKKAGGAEELFEFLVEPLHEELYKQQDFTFIDELSPGQQLLISYDYTRMQVLQGGFIQMIQNGYIGILPAMPEWLKMVNAPHMAQTIDDVLKVYVLNRELLDKETSVEEFAKLYDELKEFEMLDEQFTEQNDETLSLIADYALAIPVISLKLFKLLLSLLLPAMKKIIFVLIVAVAAGCTHTKEENYTMIHKVVGELTMIKDSIDYIGTTLTTNLPGSETHIQNDTKGTRYDEEYIIFVSKSDSSYGKLMNRYNVLYEHYNTYKEMFGLIYKELPKDSANKNEAIKQDFEQAIQ